MLRLYPQARGVQNFAAEICAAKCYDNVVSVNLDKFWRLSVLDKHVVARGSPEGVVYQGSEAVRCESEDALSDSISL